MVYKVLIVNPFDHRISLFLRLLHIQITSSIQLFLHIFPLSFLLAKIVVVMPIKEKMTKKQLKWFGYMQRSLEEIIIIGDLTEINVP